MFGQNKVTSPYRPANADEYLKVTELFYTIQGEGPDAGCPAIFLRLTHCNLRCYFCDTKFDNGEYYSLDRIAAEIVEMSARKGCHLLVITGGEPLLQDFTELVSVVNKHGISVSVETAGTVYYPELDKYFSPLRTIENNLIVCSPKTPKVHRSLEPLVGAWKYIVRAGETDENGLPFMSTQREGERSSIFIPTPATCGVPIYIQPMDEDNVNQNNDNMQAAARSVMENGYRLSIQLHKLVGVP